eukprot:CAMPEP_0197440234 /NCGR_PEP_ID=MMETSP1175-20131217/6786_1 /TAXON_ID=1003142 /ORGANISM="Triceratium dubium, Strain CCMP147" /LENGTH=310 /DNA_ID=CAMNT_0042970303 /DNA_START=197 /DNA_END=1129 /DNA_ORIENTATION=-
MGQATDSSSTDTIFERIAAMRLVESSKTYQCRNYLDKDLPSCSYPSHGDSVDVGCRAKMIEWLSSIAEFCGFDRDTVCVATSLSDRFLSQSTQEARNAINDRRQFQLLFITALHVSVKVREPAHMDGPLLSKLSRGKYAAHEFAECERHLLEGLHWRISCPTATDFVYELLSFLPKHGIRPTVKQTLLEVASRMSALAMSDCEFITTRPSLVALAAILESVRCMSYRDFPSRQRKEFFASLEEVGGTSITAGNIPSVRMWLKDHCIADVVNDETYPDMALSVNRTAESESSLEGCSPVCVSSLSFRDNNK